MRAYSSCSFLLALTILSALVPEPGFAQPATPLPATRAIGDAYRIEISGALWGPSLQGTIASEQYEIPASTIDFVNDFGFERTRIGDFRLVLRPARKHKFRVQYTPLSYSAQSTFSRDISFNGTTYPRGVPVNSKFDWKVWRFGYEYDFIARDRGHLGFLIEGRYTEMKASLLSSAHDEYTRARAPLPAFGLVGRVYPLPALSLTAEISGFKLPNFDDNYKADYADIDLYATFNIVNNLGIQAGWRRTHAFLIVEKDRTDNRFQGLWFGGVARF